MENRLQMKVAKVSMLNDLNTFSNNYSIRVKIVTMSRKMMNQNKNETYRLDMIFMDEMGTMIQASCLHKMLERFKDFLQLDQCLLITKPSLAANKSSAKYTNRNDKISLYSYTSIEKCLDWSGPKHRFNFVNLKDVVQNKIEVNTVIDWIGYVEVCFNLEDTTKKDGSKYVEKISASSSSNEHVGSYVISSVEDEFLNNPDFMLIGFLGTILTTMKVLVLGPITTICTDKLWYYNGCNHCKSSVEERFVTKENVDGSFDVDHTKALVCTNDKCEAVDIYSIPRFKVPIRVQDSSGTVSLTLFDYEAYKILKKSAKELLAIQDQVVNSGEIPNPYPEIFDTLIGKKYAFIINVKDYNIEHQVENYGIAMATNDDEILAALYAKFNLNQCIMYINHEQSESLDVPDSCSLSTPVDLMKDEMSCSGDNVTPASKALVGNKNPSSDETKRNIREVCDVDDALGCSSTKRRMSDKLSQDEDAGVSKLLIPKIEK
ncbi:uncharacterized protein LOC110875367 [Helianthus annuus]|uniref:uncharacterized protein LOC110875367 n=1 Tax=Helianthus annuus TaxID=4232 RepID=UPI000B90379B|nr:uncharacterized protein LOC110875367 [Helianthus annuus]